MRALPAELPIAKRSPDGPPEPGGRRAIGLAAIVFILVWLAIGLEIALLGAALVVGFEVVLRAVSSTPEPDSDDDPSDSPRARSPDEATPAAGPDLDLWSLLVPPCG